MFLSGQATTADTFLDSNATSSQFHNLLLEESSKGPPGGWSSLIGIITAIIGNILISFALNTQRYAHLRLSRDREESEEKQKSDRRSKQSGSKSYGTQQSEVAEQRRKQNAKSEPHNHDGAGYTLEADDEQNETDPLIPHVDSRRSSASSDETAKPNEKAHGSGGHKSYLQSPIWWLGIGLMTVGEAGNFLAYGFAPASIVSPLGVVALVSNCLIAPLLLGERFRWRDGVGVIIAVAGCVTVVLSASDSNPKLTPDSIWHLITQWEFETYFGITAILMIALVVASNKYGEKTILIDLGLVGLFGGYTALSTKGIASLLSNTIWRVVTFPITYLLLAVLISTAVLQIKYVNRALQRFNATMVIPVQFVLFTLSVIVGSAVLYRDFEKESAEDAVKFVGGCALTFLGVWCITSGRNDDSSSDVESGAEDDGIDLIDEEGTFSDVHGHGDTHAGSSAGSPELRRFPTSHSNNLRPSTAPLLGSSGPPPSIHLSEPPSTEDLKELTPATTAAIHTHSLDHLDADNTSGPTDRRHPPPMHATTSAPVIPTLDFNSSNRPRTPLNRYKSGPARESPSRGGPTTPLSRQQSASNPFPDPNTTSTSNRLLARHSVVGLLPGPLTSPLSSSLSAIVADSLRRGVDNPSHTTRPRRPSGRRSGTYTDANKRPSAAYMKRHSIASGETDFDGDAINEPAERGNSTAAGEACRGNSLVVSRTRSMSATLSDLFTSSSSSAAAKRQRLESRESVQEFPAEERREEEEEEEEEGSRGASVSGPSRR